MQPAVVARCGASTDFVATDFNPLPYITGEKRALGSLHVNKRGKRTERMIPVTDRKQELSAQIRYIFPVAAGENKKIKLCASSETTNKKPQN